MNAMKKIFTTIAAAVLAGAMATAVSCGDKSSSSSSGVRIDGGENARKNMTDEEYQAAYVSGFDLKPDEDENISIMISFDRSYFGGDDSDYSEIYLIDRYFEALNNNDVQGILDCYYPGYLESLGSGDSTDTPESYVQNYRDQLASALVDNFKFEFLDVSNCQLSGDSEADSFFATDDGALENAFGAEILDKVSDRKLVTIGGYTYFTADSDYAELNTFFTEGIKFCVYTIDGKPYIF